jgi:hypothetical protein
MKIEAQEEQSRQSTICRDWQERGIIQQSSKLALGFIPVIK